MVSTRSETLSREQMMDQRNENDISGLIREKARQLSLNRIFNPHKSPSKVSKNKQNRKSKRESEKFEKILSATKENLSKASDRALPNPPVQPRTLFDEIHGPIISGEAKQNLRPIATSNIIIVIDDSSDDE